MSEGLSVAAIEDRDLAYPANAELFTKLVDQRTSILISKNPENRHLLLASALLLRGFEDAKFEAMVEPDRFGPSQKWLDGEDAEITLSFCCECLEFDTNFISRISLEIIDAIADQCRKDPSKIITRRPDWMPWNYFEDDFKIPEVYHKSQRDKPWWHGRPEYDFTDDKPLINAVQGHMLELISMPQVVISRDDKQLFREYRARRRKSTEVDQISLFGT